MSLLKMSVYHDCPWDDTGSSQMSEDEVEALVETLCQWDQHAGLADLYGDSQCEVLLGKVLKHRRDLQGTSVDPVKCGIRKDSFIMRLSKGLYFRLNQAGILERHQIEPWNVYGLLSFYLPPADALSLTGHTYAPQGRRSMANDHWREQ